MPILPTPIDPAPTPAPQRGDRLTFSDRVDAFVLWLTGAVAQFNNTATNAYNNALDSAESAVLAAEKVTLAADQVALATLEADRAEFAANVAEGAANYQGDYSAMVTYTLGQSVSYLGQIYYAKKTNLGITPVDGPDWFIKPKGLGEGGGAVMAPVMLSSVSDGALNVLTTAAGQSLTLPDAGTLPEGVGAFSVKNTGGFDLPIRDFTGKLLAFVRPSESAEVSLVDRTTAAGVWAIQSACLVGITAMQTFSGIASGDQLITVPLNGGRVLHLTAGTTLCGVVYDEVNNTWGSPTLIASGIATASFRASLHADNVVFLTYCTNTATVGVTLSITGNSITVNTPASQATNPITSLIANGNGNQRYTSHHNLAKSGNSYVLTGNNSNGGGAATEIRTIAFTVSGTTVSVGSTVSLPTLNAERNSRAEFLAAGQLVVFVITSTTVYTAQPYTLSGTTLTAGTAATLTVTSTYSGFKSRLTTDGRLLIVYATNGLQNNTSAAIISVSANVATASSVASGINAAHGYTQGDLKHLGGEKYFLGFSAGGQVNIITNTAGVVSVGTPLSLTAAANHYVEVVSPSLVIIQSLSNNNANAVRQISVNTAGASPTLAAEELRAPRVFQTGSATPLHSLEDGTRHPVSLIGAIGETGATAMGFNQSLDIETNQGIGQLGTSEHIVFFETNMFVTPAVLTRQLANSWTTTTRRLSGGSTNAKSWACLDTSTNRFYIAQVEFAA